MPELGWARPIWLCLLPMVGVWAWLWWRERLGERRWRAVGDPELLKHLVIPGHAKRRGRRAVGAAVLLAGVIVALAGPTLGTMDDELYEAGAGRVVILDLTASMHAIDVAPSRLERARVEALEWLQASGQVQLGLVVFAADPFVVTPLTRDYRTIAFQLDSLDPDQMPRTGSRLDLAIDTAVQLMRQADLRSGDIIYIGDSSGDTRGLDAARRALEAGYPVSVRAVGSVAGGPVRRPSGRLVNDADGNLVRPRVDLDAMRALARAGGGSFERIGFSLGPRAADGYAPQFNGALASATGLRAPRGLDLGPWLLLLVCVPVAWLFRRGGWLGLSVLLVCGLPTNTPQAAEPPARALWTDVESWFLTPTQRVVNAIEAGRFDDAARLSAHAEVEPVWRAVALVKVGRDEEAALVLQPLTAPVALYNFGNVLVRLHEYEAALVAYERALRRQPGFTAAQRNWEIVAQALREQREAQHQARPRAADTDAAREEAEQSARRRETGSGGFTSGDADHPAAGGDGRGEYDAALVRRRALERALRSFLLEGGGSVPAGAPLQYDAAAGDDGDLERRLSAVPDEPGELLRRRFAMEFHASGKRKRDPGAPW